MKPAPFSYHRTASVPETVALLAELGDGAKLLAGGQSLVPGSRPGCPRGAGSRWPT